VPDELALGGSLILKRHLVDNPDVISHVLRSAPIRLLAKIRARLKRTRLHRLVSNLEYLSACLVNEKLADRLIQEFKPDLIFSVAHGWSYLLAVKVSRRWNLPLVMLYQDWWPDSADVSNFLCPLVERQFRHACTVSQVALCVSVGMQVELRSPPNCVVLHDIPSKVSLQKSSRGGCYRIVYFGNLHEYGPMIENALRYCLENPKIRLEVFGPAPNWSPRAEDEFRSMGLYHGLVSPREIQKQIARFDAGLIVMRFDEAMQRRMRTSFPSKLIEMAQFGKPLVIWGPEYCSAVQWARKGGRALCVTDPNPCVLGASLEALAASPIDQDRLAIAACQAARTDFNPERIRTQFMGALESAIKHTYAAKPFVKHACH